MTAPALLPSTAGLAPHSARHSHKRARVLFGDGSASSSAPEHSTPTAASVPPLYDPVLHKGSIARRIRLRYPAQVSQLALQGEEDEIRNERVSSKESGTMRAVREIRREAFERLKGGDDYGKSKEEEGRLVVRGSDNADVLGGAGPATGGDGTDGAIVLAGSRAKAQAAEGRERAEGQPIRPGGILVVSFFFSREEHPSSSKQSVLN